MSQLASVIAQMNSGAGPDLLGVCEVENRFVLELLVGALAGPLPARKYKIVHADTKDATAGLRVHGTTQGRPAEVFAAEEQPCLLPVPVLPYDLPIYARPKVHRDHHLLTELTHS